MGVPAVHTGVAAELGPLVAQVDFAEIKSSCGSVAITGHSLGGGLAQLMALALTNPADALNASMTVDALYTFGPMAVTDEKEGNAQAADGCFAGSAYVTSLTTPEGDLPVDTVKTASVGG